MENILFQEGKKRNYFLFAIIISVFLWLNTGSCKKDRNDNLPQTPFCDNTQRNYSEEIKPIIEVTCSNPSNGDCHQSGSVNGDYTTFDGVKEKVDIGVFKSRVVDEKSMPPPTSNGPASLTSDELLKIRCWLEDGAPDN